MVDRQTQAQINSLLRELREWTPGQPRLDVQALARRFRLDPMMVTRLAQAEGIPVDDAEPASPTHGAPRRERATLVMDPADDDEP
jgi:hypothetical protein